MSNSYRKQHILPKVYLKYFSLSNDGKDLYVMHLNENREPKIHSVDSGNRIFWEENYYDSIRFKDRKTIEKSFNTLFESNYVRIIERISEERPIGEQWIKDDLRIFIFFSVHRSPSFRFDIEKQIELESWLSKVYAGTRDFLNVEEKDRQFISKELHLGVWTDQSRLEGILHNVLLYLGIKRWEILIAPEGKYWLTSDDPCVEYGFDEEMKNISPKKVRDFKKMDSMFVPLTKKYCLHIYPYGPGDDPNINLEEDVISYRCISDQELMIYNKFSFLTMHRLVISPEQQSIEYLLLYVFLPTLGITN